MSKDVRKALMIAKGQVSSGYLPPGDPQRTANLARHMEGSAAPPVLYHGTSKDADFKKFNIPKNGAWFTTSADDASSYANDNPIGTFSLLVQGPVVVRRAVYNPVSLISLPVVNFPWEMLLMAKHHRNIAAGI